MLQRACREWRRRAALLRLDVDLDDLVLALLQIRQDLVRLVLAPDDHDVGLGFAIGRPDLFLPHLDESREKMVFRVHQLAQFRLDRPILLRRERPNLALAFDHEPHRDRLHAPGAQPARDTLVEQRGNLVAHDAVENSPRLL